MPDLVPCDVLPVPKQNYRFAESVFTRKNAGFTFNTTIFLSQRIYIYIYQVDLLYNEIEEKFIKIKVIQRQFRNLIATPCIYIYTYIYFYF